MGTELVIQSDLQEAVQDVLDLGNMESMASIEEVLSVVFKFYGAVANAVEHCVITPEEGSYLHHWLVAMFELKY
jgi:hypothetical protein